MNGNDETHLTPSGENPVGESATSPTDEATIDIGLPTTTATTTSPAAASARRGRQLHTVEVRSRSPRSPGRRADPSETAATVDVDESHPDADSSTRRSSTSFLRASSLLQHNPPPIKEEPVEPSQDVRMGTRPSGASTEQVLAATSIVDKEFSKNLPNEAVLRMRKEAVRLAGRIRALQRTVQRLEKLSEEERLLQSGRCPNGKKQFAVSYEHEALDQIAVEADTKIELTFKAGMTARQMKESLYYWALGHQTSIDRKVCEKMKTSHIECTRRSYFITQCSEILSSRTRLISKLAQIGLDFEDNRDGLLLSPSELEKRASNVYKSVIEEAAKQLQRDEEQGAREERNKRAAVEALVQKSPAEHFHEAVDASVRKALAKARPKAKSTATSSKKPMFKADEAEAFVKATTGGLDKSSAADLLSKNGKSPVEGGQNQPPANRSVGRGKGRGFNQTKSRGKGKSSSKASKPSKGKWKGKSKSKGKAKGKSSSKGAPNKGKSKHKGDRGK